MNSGFFAGVRVRGAAAIVLAAGLSACGGPADAPQVSAKAAKAPAAPAFDFEKWIAANAGCKGDYIADLQDAQFAQRLREAGVDIGEDSSVGEVGVGSGTLKPGRPARLHGFPVKQVTYFFDSGAMFAVQVEASAEQARAAIGAKPLPAVYREEYTEGVPTAEASENVPMPDIQFVRAGEQPGTQEIGCAAFDG
ncbi:hypothetical protein J5226_19220 [Lysobacter sp. K5869]|uniref:hypothetical protein n=1 Tax=Lysobacter sp. K5869 TaxID=2820808 RepID=UPI001C063574|nr:hypothetical protein [Lysobacter sp. K5869]QWP75718.1 hypothetical protein J5226_19220 [Lysobacter sp. K5869]